MIMLSASLYEILRDLNKREVNRDLTEFVKIELMSATVTDIFD